MSTPTSATNQGPSFKTNVNRAKTKRWVEAKSYTYDGDDWGDVDEYDEYQGYDEPAPVTAPTGYRQRGQSLSKTADPRYDQDVYQSPVSLEGPSFPQQGAAVLHQQYGGRHETNPPIQSHSNTRERGSFEHGDSRRAFSAGPAHQIPMHAHPPEHQPQDIGTRDFQRDPSYPDRQAKVPGTSRLSGHSPTPPRADSQARPEGMPQAAGTNFGHSQPIDHPRTANNDGRSPSITGSTSASGFPDRRDFSPSAMPQPLQTRNPPSPHHDSRPPPRKSSLGQQSQPSLPSDPHAPPAAPFTGPPRDRAGSSSSTQGTAFIRPADIYRRMEEERQRERQSHDSARPSMDVVLGKSKEPSTVETNTDVDPNQRLKPILEPVTERKSEYGVEGGNIAAQPGGYDYEDNAEKRRTTSKTFAIPKASRPPASQSSTLSPSLVLPDPTRMSGFGEGFGDSFMGTPDSHGRKPPAKGFLKEPSNDIHDEQRETDLRHQPSKGFTSAVHQAFDTAQDQVPPTPNSTTDSFVARSSSGGTNAVSPIMSRGPSAVDKERAQDLPSIDDVTTPTQEEEIQKIQTRNRGSGSFATLTQGPQIDTSEDHFTEPPPPGFKLGHRRHSSTPSPDNSPARTPMLASMSHLRHPQEADYAHTTPTPTDSVASANDSFQDSERSASPSKPFLSQRTDSSSSGRVKNLTGKFESASRPDSAQSNTTPRASILAPNSPESGGQGFGRPTNERLESFRPALPGGWQSSASIEPSSTLGKQNVTHETTPGKDTQSRYAQPNSTSHSREANVGPQAQEEPSKIAFSAAADAGNASAGAVVAAVGMHESAASRKSVEDRTATGSNDDYKDHLELLATDTSRSSDQDAAKQDYFPSLERSSDAASAAKQPSSLPPLSTKAPSGEYESDRLRREIVRELSPGMRSDPTTAESDSPYQPSSRYPTNDSMRSNGRQSTGLPSEYDSYWNDDSEDGASALSAEPGEINDATTAQRQPKAAVIGKSPSISNAERFSSGGVQPELDTQRSPRSLNRKFSWEEPLAELSSPTNRAGRDALPKQQEPQPVSKPSSSTSQTSEEVKAITSTKIDDSPSTPLPPPTSRTIDEHYSDLSAPNETPRLAIITSQNWSPNKEEQPRDAGLMDGLEAVTPGSVGQPVTAVRTQDSRSPPKPDDHFSDSQSQPDAKSIVEHTPPSPLGAQLPLPAPPASSVPKLPAFREIMSLKSPQERIRAFSDTQSQFARINTGLEHWLAATASILPEHGDLVRTGGRSGVPSGGHKSSPSGSKVQGQPYYQQYLDASAQPQNPNTGPVAGTPGSGPQSFSPSGGAGGKISTQQVQAKGKEILHTAGVFGGKTSVAAKGLFSKGRSKLRDASSGKKASPFSASASTSRGMQSQHATSHPRTPIRHSQTLQANGADSEQEAQSTQSQLADDERSVESTAENSDRLPRSSKIFRKRDSSEKRQSKSHEPSPAVGNVPTSPSTQLWTTQMLMQDPESNQRSWQENSTPADYDLPVPSTQTPESTHSNRISEGVERHVNSKSPGQKPENDGSNRHSSRPESHGTQLTSPGSSTPADSRLPIQVQDEQRKSSPRSELNTITRNDIQHEPPPPQQPLKTHFDQPKPRSTLEIPGSSSQLDCNQQGSRLPSRDISTGRPSIESLSGPLDPHRPPSPLSPDLPIQSMDAPRGRQDGPVHHGIEHNFVSEGNTEQDRRRSQSFSRPFKTSESRSRSRGSHLQHQPARRPSAEELAMPIGFYPASITREEALMPRQQAPEYALEGVGPPDIPPKDTKSRSRRGSRSSALFKSLTKTFTDSDSHSIPQSAADQVGGSPAASSTNLDGRSKRSSIFGLHRSRTNLEDDSTKCNENLPQRPAVMSRGASNVTQIPAPAPPPKSVSQEADDEFPMRPKQRTSTGLSKKFQRSPTSTSKDLEGTKKNRFSAIGSLFSRSHPRRQSSTIEQSKTPSAQHSRKPSHVLPATREDHDYRATPAGPSQAPYEYYTPKPPPPSDQPPIGGFYAPKSLPQPPQSAAPNPAVPGLSNVPAYVQDSSYRQPASPEKEHRSSIDFLRKSSQNSIPVTTQRRESRGSAWNRFSKQKSPVNQSFSATSSIPAPSTTSQHNDYASALPPPPPQQAVGEDLGRHGSPPPPPPPPKDDWHRATPRRSSLAPNQQSLVESSTMVSPSQQRPFQGLPPLQTDVQLGPIRSGFTSPPTDSPAKKGMSYDEKRRSRQWEIELGHMSPGGANKLPEAKRRSRQMEGGNISPEEKRRSRQMEIETGHLSPGSRDGISPDSRQMVGGLRGLGEDRRWEEEEPVRMSATSFPGQEWKPGHDYAWLGDH